MAHKAQRKFCNRVKETWQGYFKNVHVLDVGSLDINGNNRYLFENSTYTGIDIAAGPNVDIVALAHELDVKDSTFDVIVSTECFEHDMYYEDSLKNIVQMLKPNGLFFFTCATTGRKEHGTKRSTPADSPFTSASEESWSTYYKNLTETDIRVVIDIETIFSEYYFEVNKDLFDLYFWGIKRI